ncbi:alpha/beta fold hydrolase [Cumulibacter manganitolerans]|uniref:alpha/beta fold hydrolase n=1 Tax=Cumulibacter manganitolerans TaxID=1884992 RepID=UPI0012958986|nr:alpha/beta hydrolase [Cumulibacter manganitolerans]
MALKSVGTGDHAVLCLHGWFGSAEGWGFLPDVVNGEAYTYHFPELRGYGARRSEIGEYSMKEYAADALAAADEAGIERFSIVGHSMGGKAAAALVALAPDRVRALVGISPVAPAPVPLDEDSHALFFGAPTSTENRCTIIDFTTGNRHGKHWLDSMVAHSERSSTVEAFTGAVTSWVNDDYLADAANITTPIRVIAGEHDPALSADVMRASWMQIYPNVDLVELPAAGHYAMYETPVALVNQIESFLEQH